MIAAGDHLKVCLHNRVIQRSGELANAATRLRNDRAAFIRVGSFPAVANGAGSERIVGREDFAGFEHGTVD